MFDLSSLARVPRQLSADRSSTATRLASGAVNRLYRRRASSPALLTGYPGDAGDKAHELCETAIGTLLDAAEADTNETSRNILLGQVENLLHASGWEPLLVARLEEERGHTAEAREAYERAGTAVDVRRILRKQAAWEEAAALGRRRRGPRVAARGRQTCSSQASRTRWAAVRAGTPLAGRKRWRRCATIEPERRCPDRCRQRRRGRRIRSASGPGRSPPAWVASRRPDRYRASAPRPCRAPSSRGTSPSRFCTWPIEGDGRPPAVTRRGCRHRSTVESLVTLW